MELHDRIGMLLDLARSDVASIAAAKLLRDEQNAHLSFMVTELTQKLDAQTKYIEAAEAEARKALNFSSDTAPIDLVSAIDSLAVIRDNWRDQAEALRGKS